MRYFQQRRPWRKVFESNVFMVFLGIAILFFSYNMVIFWGKMKDTEANLEAAQAKVAELKQGKELLSADISKLESAEGQEAIIREKFGLVKEGEGLIVVVDEEANEKDGEKENSRGFFNFFKDLFD